jgi:Domain of unknown function (DUF4124)
MRTALALLLLGLLSFPACAADIYRWVDENGKVHVSDVVPEKYRNSAKRIDSRESEVSPQQRRDAEARAAAERAKADAAATAAPADAAQSTAQPARKPAAAAGTECEQAHRLYKESVDCFAPFVTAGGAVKGDAFKQCTALPDPSPRCGPPKPESSAR